MAAPEEVLVGPAEVYWAPVSEPRPDIDATPSANWAKIATLGSERFGEKGVIVRAPRTNTDINALGTTTPIKNVITQSGFECEFDVLDFTPEVVALGAGIDPDDITTVAAGGGDAGFKNLTLPTSPIPFQASLLIRFPSPSFAGGTAEFWIPTANQLGNMEAGFTKGGATFITHLWRAVKGSGGWVQFRVQTSAVSP